MKKLILKKSNNINNHNNKYKINYELELNESQLKAVLHKNGAAVVIAGAGTGKTRTLIYRVARLIEDGIPPNQILLLTFTKKAASEMMNRASSILDNRVSRINGGTFHSFAMNTLKQYPMEIGFQQNFNVIDSKDAEDVVNFIRNNYLSKYTSQRKKFPNKSVLLDIFSKSINKSVKIEQIINDNYLNYDDYLEEILEINLKFQNYKQKSNLMDYDDLLLNLKKLLVENENIREKIQDNFQYLMIDEYQDTNKLQHLIVQNLTNKNENVMVVGDEAQSIYSFRGSDFQNIIFFPANYTNCITYKIEENYRSNNQILNLSNFIINESYFNYSKNLYSSINSELLPRIIATYDEKKQSLIIVQQILEYLEEGIKLKDICILFRSAFHSFDLEIELNKSLIPYKKFGGFKFMETSHIKDIISYIRVIYNPNDLISWQRILLLLDGVGNVTVSKFNELILNGKLNFSNYKDVITKEFKNKKILELFDNITKYDLDIIKVGKLINNIIDYYKPLFEKKYDEKEKRWKDVDSFKNISENYKNINTFINDMALDPPSESISDLNKISDENDFLCLSTIHSAKGLEWKVIFIIWAVEGKFPSLKSVENNDRLEEERRLFYVATTRAKDELYILYPQNYIDMESGYVLSRTSRFLDKVDQNLADFYVLVEE